MRGENLFLKVLLGRASLGNTPNVFVLAETTGRGMRVFRPPRSAVTVDEQLLVGPQLTGKVRVTVLETSPDGTSLVEIKDGDQSRRETITSEGKLVPKKGR